MLYEKIQLRPDDPDIYLESYCCDKGACESPALLILPGGGYRILADREGEPIARAFGAEGFNCFVLHYSLNEKAAYPRPLIDAGLAVRYIRENAERYHTDGNRLFAVGFSAGGHLCGMLGTMWHRPEIAQAVGCSSSMLKVSGVMLIYPVVSAYENPHRATIEAVSGGDDAPDRLLTVSVEKNVDERSVPAFFMHTAGDKGVGVHHSLLGGLAYAGAGVPFEMHIYPFGPHGIALADSSTSFGNADMEDAEVAKWVALAARWARRFF